MKQLFLAILTILILASCSRENPADDAVTTVSSDTDRPVVTTLVTELDTAATEITTPVETGNADISDPAADFNAGIRRETTTIEGFFPDTNVWAYDFASVVCPGEISSKELFDFEKGAVGPYYSENYETGYTIWVHDDIRILLVYVIEDNLYTLSYAELLEDSFTELRGRDLCRILNEDGRFGSFTYPEPQSSDGVLAMNLTTLCREAILTKFPQAEEVSYIQDKIVGVFEDSFILLYYYYIGDEAYPCSVTVSIPSFIAGETVTVTPGWPDNVSNLASSTMISEDGYSARYNDNGDLILINLNTGEETVVDKCVSGENIDIQSYHVPRFWKFTDDGKMLYHVGGWEHYIGLGCYDIAAGENHIHPCSSVIYGDNGIYYTQSSIMYDDRFALYKLTFDGEAFSESEIVFPEEVLYDGDYPNITVVDESRVVLISAGTDGSIKVTLAKIDDTTASILWSRDLQTGVASPQYPHVFGNYLFILCERHAMADEYAYAIPLDLEN